MQAGRPRLDRDADYCLELVAFNSLFQMLYHSVFVRIFVTLSTAWLRHVRIGGIAPKRLGCTRAGVPFAAGLVTWLGALADSGQAAVSRTLHPGHQSANPGALPFTIVVMFPFKGPRDCRAPASLQRHNRERRGGSMWLHSRPL